MYKREIYIFLQIFYFLFYKEFQDFLKLYFQLVSKFVFHLILFQEIE